MATKSWSALICALALSAPVGPAAAQSINTASADAFLSGLSLPVPRGATTVAVCHGYGCPYRAPIHLGPGDVAVLRSLLAQGSGSPAAERRAIARAVAWFERKAGPIAGTVNDTPSTDPHLAGKRGEQDCIDEAATTTGLLVLLEAQGMLRHHRVAPPIASGFLSTGYPHITAVIAERVNGTTYAVDSWADRNGVPPIVMQTDRWLAWANGRQQVKMTAEELMGEPSRQMVRKRKAPHG